MIDNILPEEKLLKLIRGDRKTTIKTDSMLIPNIEKKQNIKLPLLNLSMLTFNRTIKLILLISSLWLIFLILQPHPVLNKLREPDVTRVKSTNIHLNTQLKTQIKPYSFYIEGIKNHKIFSSAAADDAQKSIGAVSADLIKDINLVGIISGEEPQAVIEDKKAQKTYYLKKGQYIGELRLENILEGKIILNYNGQSYELYL